MDKLRHRLAMVPMTDDVAEMADYVRSREGREAIEAGLRDFQEGMTLDGRGTLSTELKKRAKVRRRV